MQTTEITTTNYQGTCHCGKPVTVGWIDKDSDGDYWRHNDRSHITDECVPVRYWEGIEIKS